MVNIPPDKAKRAEREAAFEKLTQAIREFLQFEGWTVAPIDGSPIMLGDYIILASQQGWDKEGEPISGLATIVGPNGNMPWYRIIGLIEEGRLKEQAKFMEATNDDDD